MGVPQFRGCRVWSALGLVAAMASLAVAIPFLFQATLPLAGAGVGEFPRTPPPDDSTLWVARDPVQCEWLPWEQDWLESHDWDLSSYPWDADSSIIIDYYARQDIEVFEVDWEYWPDPVPAVCSAEAGYTMFLLVSEEDVEVMVSLDYRVVER